jgi:hypothetical protein
VGHIHVIVFSSTPRREKKLSLVLTCENSIRLDEQLTTIRIMKNAFYFEVDYKASIEKSRKIIRA